MTFSGDVVLFEVESIPIIGNLETGYVIGLTNAGYQVCKKIAKGRACKSDIAKTDESLLWHLDRGGFFEKAKSSPSIQRGRTAYLHVTSKCNLDCLGCYSRMTHDAPRRDMQLPKLFRALDFLKEFGTTRLVVSGGEPFLCKDLPQILQYAKQVCEIAHVDVVTNGTIINPCILDQIQPHVDRVCISLDGSNSSDIAHLRGGQRFEQLMDSVLEVQKAGIAAHILPTLHAMNVDDLDKYMSLAERINATISFSLLSAIDSSDDIHGLLPSDTALGKLAKNILKMRESLSKDEGFLFPNLRISVCRLCGLGEGNISVGADGSIYPCHMLHFDEFKLGSAISDSIDDVYSRNPFCH